MKKTPDLQISNEQCEVVGDKPTFYLNIANTSGKVRNVIHPLEDDKSNRIYELDGFAPVVIGEDFLRSIGIESEIDNEALLRLIEGSEQFRRLYQKRTLTPAPSFDFASIDLESPLEVHNYTGMCPTYVQELTPSVGACSIACQYCLVTDGDHQAPTKVWQNYPELVSRVLKEKKDVSSFYYFSPKTEAFSEHHLETGIAHGILQSFVDHFERHPDSKARMFIATKAGMQHMDFEHDGRSIIDLLTALKGKVQINGSIGIMPDYLRDVLEPNAASIDDRLRALQECQKRGLYAESVLAQPLLLPYMTEDVLDDYFSKLSNAGIKNIKPEFLTVDPKNLAFLSQFVHHFNPELMKDLLEVYIGSNNNDHRKQRLRLAPDRETSIAMLRKLEEYAKKYGISISICNWVKRELSKLDPAVRDIDNESSANGYRCLGYQTELLTLKRNGEQ
jgi:DNA repair photolyase